MNNQTILFLSLSIIVVFSCSTIPQNNGLLTLDDAIVASAEHLRGDLVGRKVAVVAFGSGSEALSNYIIDELSRMLVSSRAVIVVDRRELDLVREELQFNLSGEVSDESAQAVGRMLGAQTVITGTLTDVKNAWRFSVKAINVETAMVESMPGYDIQIRDERIVHLLRQGSIPVTPPLAQITQRVMPRDLSEVFGTEGVTNTFNAIHVFLQNSNSITQGRREHINQQILLGDWIDLPHLTVQGNAGGGSIDIGNIDLGANGKLLRLIVVGIDSFVTTNNNAPAHIVFQFQNIPGTRRMSSSEWNNEGYGYNGNEMRHYLIGNFLRGLITAGVPENVLYAPTRYIVRGEGRDDAQAIADFVWLPTMWELWGFNYFSNEIEANQARLEYYQESIQLIKYNTSGSGHINNFV